MMNDIKKKEEARNTYFNTTFWIYFLLLLDQFYQKYQNLVNHISYLMMSSFNF